MLWFTVWAVLVAGTLVGGFFLLRSVYRKGKATLRELTRLAEVHDQLADRVDELTEARERAAADRAERDRAARSPDDPFGTRSAEDRRAQLQAQRAERRAVRDARHEQTYRRWRGLTGLS